MSARYADHCYIVLTLQKLIRLRAGNKAERKDEPDTSDSDSEGVGGLSQQRPQTARRRSIMDRIKSRPGDGSNNFSTYAEPPAEKAEIGNSAVYHSGQPVRSVRTLQRYRGGPNAERIDFMEAKSALTARNLAVSVEQVSIFLTADNTVITFFEHSAADVLNPLLNRLHTTGSILRRAGDPSMLTQAVIDAIIDLAM